MLLQKLRRAVRPNIVLPSVDHNWRFFFPSRVLPNQHAAAVRQASSMHMQQISASSQDAVDLYDTAVTEYLLLTGNPVETLHKAVAIEPDFLTGHLLTAWLYVLGTGATRNTPNLKIPLDAALELVRKGVGTKREQALTIAADAWANGRLRLAAAMLEAQLADSPTDILITRLLHDTYYSLGDARNLRDSVGRVVPYWDPTMPGFGRLLGMSAFGYEETLQYERAEALGMQALNMDPDDVWALHAVLHVYEMNSRLNEGSRLLRETADHWQKATLFDNHMFWHWGLLALEAGDYAKTMHLYDNHLTCRRGTVFNSVDAVSLLWRLDLADSPVRPKVQSTLSRPSTPVSAAYLALTRGGGVDEDPGAEAETSAGSDGIGAGESAASAAAASSSDVATDADRIDEEAAAAAAVAGSATRWTEAARRIRPFLGQHITPFNDVHIAMALAASGDIDGLSDHLRSMEEAAYAATDGAISQQGGEIVDLVSGAAAPPVPWPGYSSTHSRVLSVAVDNWGLVAHSSLQGTGNTPPAILAGQRSFGSLTSAASFASLGGDGGSPIAPSQLTAGERAPPAGSAVASFSSAAAAAGSLPQSITTATRTTAALQPQPQQHQGGPQSHPLTLSEAELADLDTGADVFRALVSVPDMPVVARTVSLDLCRGMAAFVAGDARTAASFLGRTRPHWHTIGGSNAQRDVFELTYIHALMQCGELRAARTILGERVSTRFASPQAYFLLGSCASLMGDAARATDARNRAYVLGMSLEKET